MHKSGKTFLWVEYIHVLSDEPVATKIRITDVITYFKTQAPNITSGIRQLGSIVGDWRYVDAIAQDALNYFKEVNVVALRRAAKRAGLTPKF